VIARHSAVFGGARGVEIFRQSWLPDGPVRAVLVIVHGLGEHSDRYDHVARAVAADGIAVHAEDHRGHGRSQGARALVEVAEVVRDVDTLVGLAATEHPGVPVFMLGHSLGGMIAVRYALAHQARLSGLILSGALATVDASPALRRAGRLIAAIAPRAPLIALDAELVSRDPAVVANYRADPLVHHGRIPARTAAEIADTTDAFGGEVAAITLPTLIVYGTADGLCPPAGSVMLGERLGSTDVTIRAYEGLYHEVLNEPEREMVIADVRTWLEDRIEPAAG
jgi:acylglycerol lipase